MNSPSLVRWGAIGAVVAGLAWAAASFFNLVFPGNENGPLALSAEAIAEGGMLVAILGLRVLQARSLGKLGNIGFTLAFCGVGIVLLATLLGVAISAAHLLGILLDIMFGLGLLGWLVGFVLLGIATFRAKVLAGWYGLLVAAYPLLLLVLLVTFGAGTLAGLVWLVLGYALWTGRDTVGERSSRVR
jgi:hypothetical protein